MHEMELQRRAASAAHPFPLSFSSDSLPFPAVQRWWSGQLYVHEAGGEGGSVGGGSVSCMCMRQAGRQQVMKMPPTHAGAADPGEVGPNHEGEVAALVEVNAGSAVADVSIVQVLLVTPASHGVGSPGIPAVPADVEALNEPAADGVADLAVAAHGVGPPPPPPATRAISASADGLPGELCLRRWSSERVRLLRSRPSERVGEMARERERGLG
uniref:Uncharacterized protein n=1 Tax=Oryza glumipatula TaxID=40148 RepID=A0A0D9Y869_9ORYZ